jgi:3'(2'),5'-bisphosphate nucleotidase
VTLKTLIDIGLCAGREIMSVYADSTFGHRHKGDGSPVTEADNRAEAHILRALAAEYPDIPVVAEEEVSAGRVPPGSEKFFLVDPLDGTREFIAGRDEFTVNIAIVHDGRPVSGIVGTPALNTIWRGALNTGAERLQLACGSHPKDARNRTTLRTSAHKGETWRAMVSRSHADPATEQWLKRFPAIERMDCGSSVKFCRIAEGAADVYPRLGRTSEWDIAAGDAVLSAAGGIVLTPGGEPLRYGQVARNLKVPAFVAWCDVTDAEKFSG